MSADNIRNYCIIAHVDHGKSTLADRMLELTGTIAKDKLTAQYLDRMDIEQERGITIKLQPVRMTWGSKNIEHRIPNSEEDSSNAVFVLNLIDTPGHVDFSYEVSRSLAAVEGALLVVDAAQGIEAQTLSNAYLAIEQGLTIIPVVNKIDLPQATPEKVAQQLQDTFGFREDEIIFCSAKTGQNVEQILDAIVERIPFPRGDQKAPLRALIFDSNYDKFKGVIAHIRIVDGKMSSNSNYRLIASKAQFQSLEVGYFDPEFHEVPTLEAGEIGYVATGLKDVSLARVGDTLTESGQGKGNVILGMTEGKTPESALSTLSSQPKADPGLARMTGEVEPLPGYRTITPMVFAGVFPIESTDYPKLREALEKLKLNDASLSYEPENSEALGFGFRCGFLGLLHMDVVRERLEREYDLSLILSAPSVRYEVAQTNGDVVEVESPAKLPDRSFITEIREPMASSTIITTEPYLGKLIALVNERRGKVDNVEYLGAKTDQADTGNTGLLTRVKISATIPLAELITDFFDQLKSISSGYASLDYEFLGMQAVEAIKLEILVSGQIVDALARIVPREHAERMGRELVEKLKEVIPRQQYEVAIQAAIGGSKGIPGKIIARADVKAFRKDVISGLYGGDRTRKDKLLDKQKKGKKRMKKVGKVELPQEAFLAVLKNSD